MNLAARLKAGLTNLFEDLDRAAERLVPWIDRSIGWCRSLARHAKTEARPRDALYGELGRRAYELLLEGGDLKQDPRVHDLLASISRRESEERARAGETAVRQATAD
jgi:hypothetical protein